MKSPSYGQFHGKGESSWVTIFFFRKGFSTVIIRIWLNKLSSKHLGMCSRKISPCCCSSCYFAPIFHIRNLNHSFIIHVVYIKVVNWTIPRMCTWTISEGCLGGVGVKEVFVGGTTKVEYSSLDRNITFCGRKIFLKSPDILFIFERECPGTLYNLIPNSKPETFTSRT